VAISDDDLDRLGRCVELARTALDDGPAPEYADTMKSLYEAKFRP
jgi:hypothetical protein